MSTTAARPEAPATIDPEPTTPTEPPEPTGSTERSLAWITTPGLVLGLVSALYGLGRTSLWLDESYSLGAVHQLGRTLRETSGTMGGYYVVLRAWTTVSESAWWMRSLSVVAAGLALVVVGRVAQRLQGARIARLTVLLTALSYLWLVYAREARSYGMVMLLTAVSWLALDHALAAPDDRARRRWWLAHSALATALPLFHGLSALQVLPHAGAVAAAGGDRRTWTRLARGLVGSLVVTGALLSVGAGKVGDWVTPLSPDLVWTAFRLLTNPIPLFTLACVGLLGWSTVGQARAARATAAGLARARTIAPVLWALAPLVLLVGLSVVRPSLVPRYLIGSTPGLALLMATGLDRITRPDLRRLAIVGLVAILATGHLDVHAPAVDGWERATTVVADEARPGDGLLLVGEADRPPFEAEWRDRDNPDLALVGSDRPLGTVLRFEDDDLSPAARRTRAASTDRIWVVGDTVFGTFDTTVDALVDGTPGSPATHREVARWAEDGVAVEVVLLERR